MELRSPFKPYNPNPGPHSSLASPDAELLPGAQGRPVRLAARPAPPAGAQHCTSSEAWQEGRGACGVQGRCGSAGGCKLLGLYQHHRLPAWHLNP